MSCQERASFSRPSSVMVAYQLDLKLLRSGRIVVCKLLEAYHGSVDSFTSTSTKLPP